MNIRTLVPAACFCATLLAATSASAYNADDKSGPYGTLAVGYENPRGKVYRNQLLPGEAAEIAAGYRFNRDIALEAYYWIGESTFKSSGGNTAQITSIGADVRWFLVPGGFVEPNVFAGYAPVQELITDDGNTKTDLKGASPELGGGMRFNVIRHLDLMADFKYLYIRYNYAKFTNDATNISISGDTSEQHGDVFTIVVGGTLQF